MLKWWTRAGLTKGWTARAGSFRSRQALGTRPGFGKSGPSTGRSHLAREKAQHENTRLLQAGSETALREARAHTARVTAELAELREAVGMPAPAEEDMRPTIERVEPTPDPVKSRQPHVVIASDPMATIKVESCTILDTAGDEAVQAAPDEAQKPGVSASRVKALDLLEAAIEAIRNGLPATHALRRDRGAASAGTPSSPNLSSGVISRARLRGWPTVPPGNRRWRCRASREPAAGGSRLLERRAASSG